MISQKTLTSSPYGKTITPADGTTFDFVTREIVIGTAGDIRVRWANGSVETLTNIPAGRYAWAIDRVYSTDTTATDISIFQ